MNADTATEECCCGHTLKLHPHDGRCLLCPGSCDRFHRTGEGHSFVTQALCTIFVSAMLTTVAIALVASSYAFYAALIHWRTP